MLGAGVAICSSRTGGVTTTGAGIDAGVPPNGTDVSPIHALGVIGGIANSLSSK
ncbi:hypothetical protein KAZ93_02575 [Patescibacteria group bacterium]|nr:hypothetical protein [Patescibacteria group bacterium]